MLRTIERRPAIRTLHGWAISVLKEAGSIRECEEHGWMQDHCDPHARERLRHRARISAVWHFSRGCCGRHRGGTRFDRRHLSGVPAAGCMTGTESADPSRVGARKVKIRSSLLLAVDEASQMIPETLHVLADHFAHPAHGASLSPVTIHIGRNGVAPRNDQEIVPSVQIHVVHASPRCTRP